MEWYYIFLIVLGILFLIILIFYLLLKSSFNLVPSNKISDNLVAIKNRIANLYIYTKGDDKIVIDAGFSAKGVRKELLKMNIIPDSIKNVFITHSDPDHIGSLSLFSKAHIYFGKGSKVDNQNNYMFLENNQIIMVGAIKVQAISTPGHRVGHMCYLIDNEFLFSGDLLRLRAGKVKPFFKFISSDAMLLLESLQEIAKLENVKMLLTGHSGYTTEFDKSIERWRMEP
ncbi:MAG: MBL fold metallo-hydrolase [Promethearchaeota archaeon]